MSKELYFTDGNNEVKYLDTTASFNLAITQDGSAFDLTNATAIDVKVANDTGYVFDKPIDMATIKQPLAGLITMPVDAEVMNALVPDDYTIEVWVTLSSLITPGSQEGLTDGATTDTTTSSTDTTTYNAIFPSDDPQGFTITENVMSDSGDVIPVMSLDTFQQEFDQLKTDLTNKVSTLQGPKGDTGQGLEIKGKVDTTSQLPKTASEGDGYLVGEELYVWTNGAWKDCGSLQGPQGIKGNTGTGVSSTTIQYQISNSATATPTGTWSNTLIATTQVNPFLWTQATLNYDDGTSKSFYLVSSKGDKGDKGDTGATGPVGPQGPVGSGLVVKGTVNDASQLPTTGNQEGYCYFVGTDLYVWDAGTWKNCGSVSPDLSKYVTVTDLNNGLNTKVTDNKNGTEQLNGVQVQPFNKLSDTIGGRNLLINTAQLNDSTGCLDQKTNVSETYLGLNIYQTNYAWDGVRLRLYYLASKIKTNTDYVMSEYVRNTSPTTSVAINMLAKGSGVVFNSPINYTSVKLPPNSGWTRTSALVNIASFPTTINGNCRFENTTALTDGYVQFAGFKFEQGSIATDWTPAPEDKVNVTDMRKPASDVAGIEEVNVKQDKIGYTPADDSKVAHLSGTNNFNTVPTVNNNPLLLASSLPSDLARTGQDANFTGKLQKSGIDVATKSDVTTAVGTATANMVDSSKPTNFTAGLKSGGVDVATAADLKSVEDSAWRELTGSNDSLSYRFLYKIHPDLKYLDVSIGARLKKDVNSQDKALILDLATIISGISNIDSGFIFANNPNGNLASISNGGTKIYMTAGYGRYFSAGDIIATLGGSDLFTKIYYTGLV